MLREILIVKVAVLEMLATVVGDSAETMTLDYCAYLKNVWPKKFVATDLGEAVFVKISVVDRRMKRNSWGGNSPEP
jgi:hypothetical protein